MRLRRQHIEGFARAVARAWHAGDGVTLSEALPTIEERIISIIEADLAAEESLEDEADKLLQAQLRAVGSAAADIDQYKARMLIKKELAKKKGFVL